MKILLVSSSSGGHIYPSLSLGDYLSKKGHFVSYLGIEGKMEETIIKENLILLTIPSSFSSFKKNPKALFSSRKIIIDLSLSYDRVVLFGGFISFAFILFSKNKNMYIHDQNVILGDSVKFSYFKVKKVFLSFDTIKLQKGVYTSSPLTSLIKEKEFSPSLKNILFIFGSQGSSSLIEKVQEIIEKFKEDLSFTLVLGKNNLPIDNIDKLKVIPYMDFKEEMGKYDLIFTRGGASTLIEILYKNIDACIIPSPYVKHDHQKKNALYFVKKGYFDMIEEQDFSYESFKEIIDKYSSSSYKYKKYKIRHDFKRVNSLKLIEKELIND